LSASIITIGPISLTDFEIPQSVRFGGRHRLTIHSLSDGRRIVEKLGPDDSDIQFQGTFSGPTAETRVRAFDNLRLSGELVWLTWQSFSRQVIVKSFVATYKTPWWIPYQVSCTVVNQARSTSSPVINLAATLSADLNYALSAATGSDTSLTALQAALSTSNALIAGTSNQSEAIAMANSTLAVVNNTIISQSAAITVPIISTSNGGEMGSLYANRVNSAGLLASAVNVRSYVGRIMKNLEESS
jgi:hypothetical protein